MATMARKTLNLNEHDNMVLNRLIDRQKCFEFLPIGVDQLFETEECAYVFSDGSALINNSYNEWRVVTKYSKGDNEYLQDY